VLAALQIDISLGDGNPWAPDSRPALLAFVAFLAAFLFIRTSARLMRSPKVPWWPGSVTSGDLHIHHLVWGIVLMLVAGFISLMPIHSPWREIMAVLFGVGAGLTLDEFALWLRLKDVYWAEEGRQSVDAVIIAATFGGLVLVVGFPFAQSGGDVALAIDIGLALVFCAISIFKGKTATGVAGFFLPLISLVGSIRLAKPGSPWAHRRYDEAKRARAEKRFPARRSRWRELIGGAPDPEAEQPPK
jgi:lysyl-tRNA synthetase class 2